MNAFSSPPFFPLKMGHNLTPNCPKMTQNVHVPSNSHAEQPVDLNKIPELQMGFIAGLTRDTLS